MKKRTIVSVMALATACICLGWGVVSSADPVLESARHAPVLQQPVQEADPALLAVEPVVEKPEPPMGEQPRACADCLTPNMDLGVIGSTPWYTISADCATEGKWYASFTGEAGATYYWDLCPLTPGTLGTGNFDADIKICDSSCAILAGVDGSCSGGPNTYLPNNFSWTCSTAGTYYVVIAPYRSYNQHNCTGTASNTFTLAYYKVLPCNVTCPGGAISEGEVCVTTPADVANDGCNMTPNTFVDVTAGTTVCGTSSTYVNGTVNSRDTDWYRITTTEWTEITWTVTSEFPSANFILSGTCAALVTEAAAYGGDCNTVSAVKCLPPGTYYLFVSVGNSSGGIFTGYPCGQYSDYVATVTTTPCPPQYCSASSTYAGCDEHISRVQFATIDNASGCTTTPVNGYGDYTALVADLAQGASYPITVTNGTPYSSDRCAAWVDWNQNYAFEAGELITFAGSPGNGPYTGTIAVPPAAPLGQTRLRVRINYNADPPACGSTTYGETEDYTINVVAATGACCLPDAPYCQVLLEADCIAAGGVFHGAGTTCAGPDCQNDGIPDFCQLANNDCNSNNIPDDCDIALGTSNDCQGDGIPDECQLSGRDVILTEGFEGGVIPPADWTEQILNANYNWKLSTTGTPHSGTYAADVEYDPDLVPQDEWLLSPSMTLFGNVTLSGWSNGSVYWGITPYDNYDLEAWIVIGATAGDGDDTLLGKIDQETWVTNWTYAPFTYTFPAPAGSFRIGFRYVGTDGAQAVLDDIQIDGSAGAPANDCNTNGVPDECDIHVSFGGYCEGAIPAECDSDYNTNGVPDHCEICGDLDGDGDVDSVDYYIFVDAYGTCVGHVKYNAAADMDGSGCINLVDYQAWLTCYRMYNGRDFSVPKKKTPAPAPAPRLSR